MRLNKINLMRQVPMFDHLTQDELGKLSQFTRIRMLKKKTILFSEGADMQSLFFVREGLVKTYKTDEQGKQTIIAYYKKGELFPQPTFIEAATYATSAASIVQTEVLVLPIAPFITFLQSHPTVALKMIHTLGKRIQTLQGRLRELSGENKKHRGQLFLLKLAEHYGDDHDGEIRIGIPMTYQEFADTIGSTREQARKFIFRLRDGGIVDMQRSGFIIHDVEALREWQEQ